MRLPDIQRRACTRWIGYIFYWLVLVLISGLFLRRLLRMSNNWDTFWVQAIATIAATVVLGTLVFSGMWIMRKWFPLRERLCEIQFVQTVGTSRRIDANKLRISASPLQDVSLYLTSPVQKQVSNIYIRFGKSRGYPSKLWYVVVNRFKEHRIFTLPSRGWLSVVRLPELVKDNLRPEVTNATVYLRSTEISASGTVVHGEYSLSFTSPVTIPVGEHAGGDAAMQVKIRVAALSEWRGVIECASKVEGVNQSVRAKVEVSNKYD